MPPPANNPGSSTPQVDRLTMLRQSLTIQQVSGEDAVLLPSSTTTTMSYLSAPVPDFAAGLYTHPDDAADEANTSFLRQSLDLLSTAAQAPRASIDQTRDPRLGLSRRERTNRPNRSTSPVQRDHLQRYLTHLYRMHNPPAGGGTAAGTTAYSNRTPSPHRQSLYDWAPASTTRPRQRESIWSRSAAPEDWENRRRPQRTAAEDQPLPSATERMLRYFMDRERSGLSEEEERARGAGWYRPSATQPDDADWNQRWPATLDEPRPHRSREDVIDAFRREYLSENAPRRSGASPHPAVNDDSPLIETAVKYLDQLRDCSDKVEAFLAANELIIATTRSMDSHEGLLLDLNDLAPFHWSSWLQSGSVFEGHQYASTAILPRIERPSGTRVHDHSPGSTHFTGYREMNLLRSHSSSVPLRALLSGGDQWPVRMVIHTVNLDDMTLQGTMEAYDVPQHTLFTDPRATTLPKAGKKSAPITTYVEGHIIDCIHHSFLTPRPRASKHKTNVQRNSDCIFPAAKPARDADNWKKLPPFSELSDKAVIETLLCKDKLDAVNEQYVFMRWKERCFVHGKNDPCSDSERHSDTDKGHGLTISGFYYISLRRSDGAVEGLYYDPNSTPYQHLRLRSMSSTWPTWQFR